MEPYILTQITVTTRQMEFQKKARADWKKTLGDYLLDQARRFTGWYLRTSITLAERIYKRLPKCYW